jgi:hypothetical protein
MKQWLYLVEIIAVLGLNHHSRSAVITHHHSRTEAAEAAAEVTEAAVLQQHQRH